MGRSAALQILVVDDNRDTADALAWLLQSRGHEARAAYDGPAALLAVERHSPDIVIQDLGLPGMNGYDIARRMRQLPAGRRSWWPSPGVPSGVACAWPPQSVSICSWGSRLA
jgi:CheY-like chemotaxis protein